MSYKKISLVLPLVLAATALSAAAPSALAAPHAVAPHVVGDAQIVAAQEYSEMTHSIRHANGSWDTFDPMPGFTGFYGVSAVSSVMRGGQDNVFFQYLTLPGHTPQLGYTVRNTDGTWTNPSLPAGSAGATDDVSAAVVNGQIALMRLRGNQFQIAFENGLGSWTAWAPVPLTGGFGEFAITGNGSMLRLVALSADGTTIMEADGAADGSWGPFSSIPFTSDDGTHSALRIAAAQVGADLEIVVTDGARLFHTIRHSNGNWDPTADVYTQIGEVDYPIDVSATASAGQLQVLFSNQAGEYQQDLFHTIRYSDGTWQKVGDVSQNATGSPSGTLVSIAGE